jgi:hypothetical protein
MRFPYIMEPESLLPRSQKKKPPLVIYMRHINLVYTLSNYFVKIHFSAIIHLQPDLPSGYVFPTFSQRSFLVLFLSQPCHMPNKYRTLTFLITFHKEYTFSHLPLLPCSDIKYSPFNSHQRNMLNDLNDCHTRRRTYVEASSSEILFWDRHHCCYYVSVTVILFVMKVFFFVPVHSRTVLSVCFL